MRYLKYSEAFNDRESIEQEKEELKEFCETYLAYLVDEDWRVSVSFFLGDGYYQILIGSPDSLNMRWSNIKDVFIPFYHMLLKDYELVIEHDEVAIGTLTKVIGRNGSNLVSSARNFEFDNLVDHDLFCSIYIRVRKKEEPKKKSWFSKLINR